MYDTEQQWPLDHEPTAVMIMVHYHLQEGDFKIP